MNFEFLLLDTQLIVTAVILALTMALAHIILGPRSNRLPRWAAYLIGIAGVWLGFAVVQVGRFFPEPVAIHYLQPVLDLTVLIVAATIAPTSGHVWMLYQEHQGAQQSAADMEQVNQIRQRTREQ